MMSLTVTQTQEVSNQTILTLIPSEGTDLLIQLADILERFQSWEDDLSKQLFKWGSNAVILTAITEGMDLSEFKTRVGKQLDILANEILVNPMTNQPLQSPLIDREWVWEESTLADYLQFSSISPYDGQPITAKTHEFAIAMIKWLRAVHDTNQIVVANDREELAIGNLIKPEVPAEQRFTNYKILASWAHAIKRQRILQNTCKAVERMYEKNAAQMRAMFREEEEKLQQRVEESEQLQKERLNILRQENQVKIDIVKSQMSDLERERGVVQEQLSSANQSIQALSARITNLLAEQSRDKQEIQRLRDEVDEMCVIL